MEQTHRKFGAFALDDDAALSKSPFRKVPAEIRLEIFGYALKFHSGVMRRSVIKDDHARERCRNLRHDFALFAVCRKIASEAREAFFVINNIYIDCLDIRDDTFLLENIRRLEIGGTLARDLQTRTSQLGMPPPLDWLRDLTPHLPKLRSITVPCQRQYISTGKTVRRMLGAKQTNGAAIRCVAIGLFEVDIAWLLASGSGSVSSSPAVKLYYSKPALCKVLPLAKKYASTHRIGELLEMRRFQTSKFTLEQFRSLRLAILLLTYEVIRACRAGAHSTFDKLSEEEQKSVRTDDKRVREYLGLSGSETISWKSELLPDGVKLMDLIESDTEYNPELLEWATEFLDILVTCLTIVG